MNPENLSLEDRLLAAEAKVAELAPIAAEAEKVTAELETLKSEKDSLEAAKTALETEAGELKAKVAALEAEAATASEKAAKIVAASGLNYPVDASPAAKVAAPRSREDILAEFRSISDAKEKAEFYNRHEATLVGR